jgi:hypothetical protein
MSTMTGASRSDPPLGEALLACDPRIRSIVITLRKAYYFAYSNNRLDNSRSGRRVMYGPLFGYLPEERYPGDENEMIRFLRESTSLEAVSIDSQCFREPPNLGSLYLSAIAENSNIQTLSLSGMYHVTAECFINLMQTTTSITTFEGLGDWSAVPNAVVCMKGWRRRSAETELWSP